MNDFLFEATTASADAPEVAPGLCDATFLGITKRRVEGGLYGDGDRLSWEFGLLADDGTPLYEERPDHPKFGESIVIDGLTSLSLNLKSKTTPKGVRYLKALMSPQEFAAFEANGTVSASALVGRKVQVEIAIRDSGWPTIVNVLPARVARVAARPAQSNTAVAETGL